MRPQELPPLTQCALRPSTHGITVEWPPAAQLGGPCVVGLCQSGHMNVKYAVIILNTSPACEHAGDLAWLELVHSVYLLCRGWGMSCLTVQCVPVGSLPRKKYSTAAGRCWRKLTYVSMWAPLPLLCGSHLLGWGGHHMTSKLRRMRIGLVAEQLASWQQLLNRSRGRACLARPC